MNLRWFIYRWQGFIAIAFFIFLLMVIQWNKPTEAPEQKIEPAIPEHYVIVKNKVMEPAFGSDRNDTYPVLYLKSSTDSNSVGAMAVDQNTFDSVEIGDTLFLNWN